MAAINNNTLYPPIMDTYLPALVKEDFDKGKTPFEVSFTVSNYTKIEEIKEVQIQIRTQNGVNNILKDSSGIYFQNVDFSNVYDRKILIQIPKSYFKDNSFEIDNFYRVQVRFSKTQKGDLSSEDYLIKNNNYFSEWSSISLIKVIPASSPFFTKGSLGRTGKISYLASLDELAGNINFLSETSEYLYNYRFRIYQNENGLDLSKLIDTETPAEDSGVRMSGILKPNFFDYTFHYDFEEDLLYTVVFEYTTSNNYSNRIAYLLKISKREQHSHLEEYIDKENVEIIRDFEQGCNIIKIPFKKNYAGNIVFRRTDGTSNYKMFDDIHFDYLKIKQNETYEWRDYTPESGVLHKYVLQERDAKGNRDSKLYLKDNGSLLELKDIFLIDKDNILKIKYNPEVGSFQPNVKDSITETLGSKYPFTTRGATVDYLSFGLNGTISWDGDLFETLLETDNQGFMDGIANDWDENNKEFKTKNIDFTHHLFANLTKIFSYEEIAREYLNLKKRYDRHHDFTIEKEFRKLVLDFLNNGKPKLYRSPTEGNILIKLSNISLTPKTELGRFLYDFSADAVEIDKCTIENYDFYNIIDLNRDYLITQELDSIIGQYQLNSVSDNVCDVYGLIKEKYATLPYKDTLTELQNLQYVTVDATDLALNNEDNKTIIAKVTANGKDFFISANLPYLELNEVEITSLDIVSYVDGLILIDYKGIISERRDFSDLYRISSRDANIGQIQKTINPGTSLIDLMKDKYDYLVGDYEQYIESVNKIIIDTNKIKNAVFLIQDGNIDLSDYDDETYPHIVDKDGFLELYDKDSVILEAIYDGIAIDTSNYKESNKYYLDINEEDDGLEDGDIWLAKDFIIVPELDEHGNPINYYYNEEDKSFYHKDSDPYDEHPEITDYQEGEYLAHEWRFADAKSNLYLYEDGEWYLIEDDRVKKPIDIVFTYFYDIERSQKI